MCSLSFLCVHAHSRLSTSSWCSTTLRSAHTLLLSSLPVGTPLISSFYGFLSCWGVVLGSVRMDRDLSLVFYRRILKLKLHSPRRELSRSSPSEEWIWMPCLIWAMMSWWSSSTPVLAEGELGAGTELNALRFRDAHSHFHSAWLAWNCLIVATYVLRA